MNKKILVSVIMDIDKSVDQPVKKTVDKPCQFCQKNSASKEHEVWIPGTKNKVIYGLCEACWNVANKK
jgi:hypothetical protein